MVRKGAIGSNILERWGYPELNIMWLITCKQKSKLNTIIKIFLININTYFIKPYYNKILNPRLFLYSTTHNYEIQHHKCTQRFKQKGTATSIDTTRTKPQLQNVSISEPNVPFAKQYVKSNKASTKVKGLFSSITELIACKMQQIFLLTTSGIILCISGIIYYYYRVKSYLTVKPYN